jgi:hypothetical protein
MPNNETVQGAWVAYLKSKSQITSLVAASQIKELEWQGQDFVYPGIRVSVDYYPSINGCGTDNFDVYLDVWSEQKSSLEAQHIAGALESLLNKHPFSQNGVKFPMVWVYKISKADRDIYGWKSSLHIKGLAN